MAEENITKLAHWGLRSRAAGGNELCDLIEDPRPPLGRAADHDGVCARLLQDGDGAFGRLDVAIGGQWQAALGAD